jgi:hypothetical protein
MKKSFLILTSVVLANTAFGQTVDPTVNLRFEARVDYQYDYADSHVNDESTGFKGKYLNLVLDGDINPHFSYSLRQRLNKSAYNGSFFDATDWVNLTFRPNEQWAVSAGKQVVGIGGYEYDRAPINIYRGSEFWNNIPCYQMGVSGTYSMNKLRDNVMFQICTNPFRALSNDNTYAYNLMWTSSHGWFKSLYSINLIEYRPGHYINYIALGNNFNFGNLSIELDLMNRASSHQAFLLKDASVMADIAYQVSKPVKVFVKGTYDVNRTKTDADYTVMSGTEMKMAGCGIEYHPVKIKKHDVRLHACYFYSWGKNGNPDGTLRNKNSVVDLGVTWFMDVLSARK